MTPATILPNPLPPHPRLLASSAKFDPLRTQIKTDAVSASIFGALQRIADQVMGEPPVTRTLRGRRLLSVSRLCLQRVSALAMVAVLTREQRYVTRACQEMRAAAGFADWNPSHFLDVGEMTLALAIGFDWLYEWLNEEDRAFIAAAIRTKGLETSFNPPQPENCWWVSGHNNWTQVCHAGVSAGAIALADTDPELAEKTLRRAIEKVPGAATDSYAPDGAYTEGPVYWDYGTSFHVTLIAALESLCGRTFGLEASPGFLASPEYINEATGPTGAYFNYCDAAERRTLAVPLFWFGSHLQRGDLLQFEISRLDEELENCIAGKGDARCRLLPLTLLWWNPALTNDAQVAALHWYGRGISPVAIHRSAWNAPDAFYIGIKAGSASSAHAHMDVGSFVLEADGVRWAIDLDKQDYESLEGAGLNLWDMSQGSDRWKVFRSGSDSHNILRFNHADQQVKGKAEFVRFQSTGTHPHSVIDLTPIYSEKVISVSRGVAWIDDHNILLQDEWTAGEEPLEVTWQMLTRAEVTLGKQELTLREAGKTLRLRVLAPEAVEIEVRDVSKPARPHDVPNPGVHQIVLRTRTAASSKGVFRVLAIRDGGNVFGPAYRPAAEWSAPLAG